MKKIIAVIPITVLFLLLSHNIKSNAETLNQILNGENYRDVFFCITNDGNYRIITSEYPGNRLYYILSGIYIALSPDNLASYRNVVVFYPQDNQNPLLNPNSNMSGFSQSSPVGIFNLVVCLKGSAINNSNSENSYFESLQDYEDYINPPDEDTWWSSMWNELGDVLGDPNFWFGEWFINIIDNVFGNDEGGGPSQHSISTHVHIEDTTITPAPTPIPYTTIVIPKTDSITGDTYYETNYYYNNPSGTPIIQPYPPTNTPSANSPSGGNEYTPINGDPFSIPVVNWLTSATIGDTNYDGIDSVGSGLDSIDEIGSEYTEGMSVVQDSTGTLPTSWILLIGVAAAIPLIAGLISRFLS